MKSGLNRVLVWCAAIQSSVGFSQILIVVLGFAAYAGGYLDKQYFSAAVSLWYLLIIIPALGSGLIITIHSLVQAWRERSIASMGASPVPPATISTGRSASRRKNEPCGPVKVRVSPTAARPLR